MKSGEEGGGRRGTTAGTRVSYTLQSNVDEILCLPVWLNYCRAYEAAAISPSFFVSSRNPTSLPSPAGEMAKKTGSSSTAAPSRSYSLTLSLSFFLSI